MSSILAELKPVRGDLNGFIQLFFDNVATLLALISGLNLVLTGFYNGALMTAMADFPNEMQVVTDTINEVIFKRSIPGLAVTMVFGNVYYTWMGVRLARNTDRVGDVTALPYGVNTPGAFAFIFSIISPATLAAASSCVAPSSTEDAELFSACWVDAVEAGWTAGVASNFIAGIISIAVGVFGNYILKVTPTVALLTALSGIGFSFLGISQISFSFAEPIAGLLPLYLAFIGYFGDVDFGYIPKSLLVVLVGVVLGWADSVATPDSLQSAADNVQVWGISTGFSALSDWSTVGDFLGTSFPVALTAAAGTLMNVLSAERAGDSYGVRETMISDGAGTMIGAIFGTPFGTSVYIGHPAYKKMGAGVFYSLANCTLFFFFAIFGIFAIVAALVPSQAVAPLILFVGLMICQEALASASVRQYPAFLVGLFPALSDFATGAGANFGTVGANNFFGYNAMTKGALLLALCTSSAIYFIIDRHFEAAAGWTLALAVLAAFGFIHQGAAALNSGAFEVFTEPDSLYCISGASGSNLIVADGNGTSCIDGFVSCGDDSCAFAKTTKLRFMGAYLLVTATLGMFWLAQSRGWVKPPVTEKTREEEDEENNKTRIASLVHSESGLKVEL